MSIFRRAGLVVAGGCALLVLVTACGTSPGNALSDAPAAAPNSAANQSGAAGTASFGPAASGEIAAKSGTTLQVQNTTSQTAVKYTKKTTFTAQRSTNLSAVRVGSCVIATGASTGSSVPLRATSVQLESSCATARGGGLPRAGSGSRPSGLPGGSPPSELPDSGQRSGAPAGGIGNAVAGKVTKVAGRTITVRAQTFGGPNGSGSTSTATTRTITVSANTTYRTTVKTTATAAKVGRCAVVQGTANSSGAVTAKSIALSAKSNGSCTTTGFGSGAHG